MAGKAQGGSESEKTHEHEHGLLITGAGAASYQAIVARRKFLGSGRPDVKFAAKGASRAIATPCHDDMVRVVRMSQFGNGESRRAQQPFCMAWMRKQSMLAQTPTGCAPELMGVYQGRNFVH